MLLHLANLQLGPDSRRRVPASALCFLVTVILVLLAAMQIGCSRLWNQASPPAADSDLATAKMAATEGVWDDDGTVAGYQKMIQRYGDVLQGNPTDITALTETAYAYSKIAWIRHFNAQYDLFGRLRRNAASPSEISSLYQQTEDFLQRARKVDSSRDIVLAVDSIIQRSRGHNTQAVSLAQQAYRPDSLNPRVLEAYEITRIDPNETRDLYRRCVSAAPNNAYYWWQTGNFETDSTVKQAAYNRALELSPNYALPKISQAMSKWLFSRDRISGLAEIANASPEFGAFARHNRLQTLVDAGALILFSLLGFLMFRAQSLGWFLLGIYLVVRGAMTFAPGIGDRAILFASLLETLSSLVSILTIVLVLDLLRAWFWPDSTWALYRLSHRVTRGFLAVIRNILQVPIERTSADFSYVLVFAELWLLNWFTQQVFTRLVRWW